MNKTTLSLILLGAFAPATLCAEFAATLAEGEVSVTLTATPDVVDPARDLMVEVVVEAPARLTATLPDLQDRFEGFSVAEDFAVEPVKAGDCVRRAVRWRLEPKPGAERYRLAPFAVSVRDAQGAISSFATKPVRFPDPDAREVVTGDAEVDFSPARIPPTPRQLALWALVALLGAGVLVALGWLLRKLGHAVKVMRLSPSQRALRELDELIARNLPGQGDFKTFYVELTQVVRRFIHRAYGVKAPNMTTEEFLAHVTGGATAVPNVDALREFLRSADLVKFAGVEADLHVTGVATDRAREFVAMPVPETEGVK